MRRTNSITAWRGGRWGAPAPCRARCWMTLALGVVGMAAGCHGSHPQLTFEDHATVQTVDARTRIAADPVTFLRDVARRCAALPGYAVDFERQERRGLFLKTLQDVEHFRVRFRTTPFSVHMTLLDADTTYAEAAYVAGAYDGQLRLRTRHDTPGAGQIKSFDPAVPAQFGFSQSPITSFGVAALLEQIVQTLDTMTERGLAPRIAYLDGATHAVTGDAVHHLRLNYDAATGLPRLQVDVQFDERLELPVACYLWLPDGQLDAKYLYSHYDFDTVLTDQDFAL